jgi:hypothetical protein
VDGPFRSDAPVRCFVESERYGFTILNRERYGETVRPAPVSYAAPDAAVRAVKSWQFTPAKENGKALEAKERVEFACPAGIRRTGAPSQAARHHHSVSSDFAGGKVAVPDWNERRPPGYGGSHRRSEFPFDVTGASGQSQELSKFFQHTVPFVPSICGPASNSGGTVSAGSNAILEAPWDIDVSKRSINRFVFKKRNLLSGHRVPKPWETHQ